MSFTPCLVEVKIRGMENGGEKVEKAKVLLFGWEGKFGEKMGGLGYFSPKPTKSHISKSKKRLEKS